MPLSFPPFIEVTAQKVDIKTKLGRQKARWFLHCLNDSKGYATQIFFLISDAKKFKLRPDRELIRSGRVKTDKDKQQMP